MSLGSEDLGPTRGQKVPLAASPYLVTHSGEPRRQEASLSLQSLEDKAIEAKDGESDDKMWEHKANTRDNSHFVESVHPDAPLMHPSVDVSENSESRLQKSPDSEIPRPWSQTVVSTESDSVGKTVGGGAVLEDEVGMARGKQRRGLRSVDSLITVSTSLITRLDQH